MSNSSRENRSSTTARSHRLARFGKWLRQTLAGLLALVVLLALPMAFPTKVIPSVELEEPTTVILIDFGHTASLILPSPQGQEMTVYAYGDWNYYPKRQIGPKGALSALLWPTPGTLMRWPLRGPVDEGHVRQQIRYPMQLYSLEVERRKVRQLRARLEQIYEEGRRIEAIRWPGNRTFVPHPERYTYFRNSNHLVADWLRELGCEIRGPAFYSNWRVETKES